MDPVRDSAWLQAMMEEAPVTASMGPMAAVLRQLNSRHPLPDGVSEAEIQRLLKGLKGLCITLKDLSDQVDEPSFTAKCWMKEVRQLCFDTQDYLDEVPSASSSGDAAASSSTTSRPRLSTVLWKHSKLNRRPKTKTQAARDFSELRARVADASKRRRRLQLAQQTSKSLDGGQAGVSHHLTPRLPIQMLEDPMDDLVKLLAFDDKKEKQLKVVSIFGFAGVGKTTAAKTLYGNHGWKFLCRAFLRVSQNPDMRSLFTSILTQIKASPPNGFPDVQNLIDTIRTHLQGKRYLIIIDDLWASSTWDIISCAFPHGDCGSRIITTTEIKDVALACCRPHLTHKYDLCPLKPEKSRKLFFSIVFGSGSCCPKDFQEISDMIVSKCGGLPLVTANIAGLLASKTNHANIASMLVSERNDVVGQWKQLHDCLPCSMMTNPTYDGMKEFLKLMYNALPPYLKTCLLYLSMYPEGHIMKKDDLVKQWVVEDFIGSEQTAGVYFDDLVNRGMIQPVNTNCIGEVLSGTVHHMVLDLIRHKSMLENFIVIVGSLPSTAGLSDKVRRLSVQLAGAKFAHVPTGLKISQVRSHAFFGFSDGMHSIEKYRLLQVLILHICADQDKDPFDLTIIGELFRLRYLNIQCNITVQLPDEIAGLQYLETLQVDAKLSAVPSDIVHLEKLLHLRLPSECILPDGFARLTSLRTLGYFDIDSNSKDNVMDLAKLANLEDLQLTCSMVHRAEEPENNEQLLCLILMKLSVLKSITLTPTAGCSPVNIPCMAVFPSLQRIELSPHCCIFFCIPQQLGGLRELCILKIAVRGLSKHDIDILKGLPLLAALTLYVQTAPPERIIIGEGGFPVLTYFKFMCAAVPSLYFLHGAMPNVQKLKLGFNLHKRQAYSLEAAGFHHLSGLMEISVKFGSWNADEFNREAVESALETTVTNHPNTLIIRVQFVDSIFGDEEYKSMAIEEKEDAALEKRREIQEGMKKSTGRSEEHVNRQVDNRYGTTDRLSTPMEHHAQPVSLGTGTMDQATGAMGALLPKLVELLKDKYKLKKKVREGVKSLQKEMESMHATLRKVAELPRDQIDKQVKLWAGEVRELSFDMEDIVDKFLVRVDEDSKPTANSNKLKRLTKKMAGLFTKGNARHEIADAIKDINKQDQEVAERRARYNIDNIVCGSAAVTLDPFLRAPYTEVTELVGIVGKRDQELTKLVSNEDNVSEQKLKIVSVVGFGGLGKTTLVKTVYDKIKGDFDCCAFVSVGRKPDPKKILMDIFLDLGMEGSQLTMLNETRLINKLRESMEKRRYLIVIDDIWDENVWKIINWAFSNGNNGSRLITTTRIVSVAKLCCSSTNDSIYQMEPLSDDDSKRLFHKRIFSQENGCPREFEGVSRDILKKCGGVPLAIITIAGVLASDQKVNSHDEWHVLLGSIGRGLSEDPSVEEMLRILSFSYYDLPSHLKTCLLYLSMFPEDSEIMKDQLIWMWIAESFIQCETDKSSLFQIGETYFNELVNRSLLQPVYHDDGIVHACRVHDSVLDIICLLSKEENFVTVFNGSMSSQGNVRRLSLQKIIKEEHETTRLESMSMLQVRSIATFKPVVGLMPHFSSFVVLRVLNLRGCQVDKDNLAGLWSLVHLRYLGLSKTPLGELPEEIGKLQFLQVLDLSGICRLRKLPSSVTKLRRLMCLLYDRSCNRLPDGIGNLTAMDELSYIRGDSLSIVKELGNMKRMRKFEIEFRHLSLELEEAFVKSLGEMSNVQSVTICITSRYKMMDLLGEKWVPPRGLRELKSSAKREFRFSRLPAWIRENPLQMSQLSRLHIGVKEVQQLDLRLLGRLPALHFLELESLRQGPLLVEADGFRCLTLFSLWSNSPGQVVFQPGALPKADHVVIRTGLPVTKEKQTAAKAVIGLTRESGTCRPFGGSVSPSALRSCDRRRPRKRGLHWRLYSVPTLTAPCLESP